MFSNNDWLQLAMGHYIIEVLIFILEKLSKWMSIINQNNLWRIISLHHLFRKLCLRWCILQSNTITNKSKSIIQGKLSAMCQIFGLKSICYHYKDQKKIHSTTKINKVLLKNYYYINAILPLNAMPNDKKVMSVVI